MKAPNILEIHARKLLGMTEDWCLYRYETLPKDAPTHFELTGAVPSKVLFKSGPRKGKPNHKFHTDERSCIVSESDHRAFEIAWEKETGLCIKCGDTGQSLSGYGPGGETFRPCTRCKRAVTP